MYHDLPRDASFWAFLFSIDQDLAEQARQKACPCGGRLHRANYPRKPRGGGEDLPEAVRLPAELLLRSGGLPQAGDAAVGAVSRPEGLSRRRGRLGRGHAARALAAAGPRAFRALRRRSAHHRSLAGLLERALSPDAVLEGRPRSLGAGGRDRRPSPGAVGGLPPRRAIPARTGGGCCDFSRRSRSPGAWRSRFLDNSAPPAEDARRRSGRTAIKMVSVSLPTPW